MTKMTTFDKFNATMAIAGLIYIALSVLWDITLIPYMAVKKAENGEFIETCAYVVDKKKVKYSYEYIIKIDGRNHTSLDILPLSAFLPPSKQKIWDNFPIMHNIMPILTVEPDICKKIKYVEVTLFDSKKMYLYGYAD